MIHAFYGPIGQHGCTIGINAGGYEDYADYDDPASAWMWKSL